MFYENIIDVGDEVPGFDLDSQLGRINFRDIIYGKWVLLATFPAAFDPVATTDMGMLCKLKDEFEARNIFIITVGHDTGKTLSHSSFSLSSRGSCCICIYVFSAQLSDLDTRH